MSRLAPRIARVVRQSKREADPRRSRAHLAFVRSLGCVICGNGPAEAAHIRAGMTEGMVQRPGAGLKSGDRWVVGLCHAHHVEQHQGELSFWAKRGIDQFSLAERLWRISGDREEAIRAIERARSGAALKQRGAA